MATAAQVITAWEKADSLAPILSVRRGNMLVDDADHLAAEAVHDEAVRHELLRILDSTKNFRLKDWLRGRVIPDVAVADEDPAAFRRHPLVALSEHQLPIRPSLALIDVKGSIKDRDLFEDDEERGDFSWLAGPPVVGSDESWPTAPDGLPHAHIVQVDLGFAASDFGRTATIFDDLGIPDRGILQLFHDLETTGWEVSDGRVGGWLVRWVRKPARLLELPAQLDRDSYRKPRLLRLRPAVSIPPAETFRGTKEDWQRYERVAQHIGDSLRSPSSLGLFKNDKRPTAWESGHLAEAPTSRIGGFGQHPLREELAELLADVLPVDGGDDHFLLFDVAGVRHLEDWFGDSGHLQVWIRRSEPRLPPLRPSVVRHPDRLTTTPRLITVLSAAGDTEIKRQSMKPIESLM